MVKSVFADTSYFLALNVTRDRFHQQALSLEATLRRQLLTTEWVLTEVADALAAPATRARFAAQIERLRSRADVTIVAAKHRQFERGSAVYIKHKDKGWSLTDCISFLTMWEHGADTALTSDRHFVQAGFRILMSSEPRGVAEPGAPDYGTSAVTGAELAIDWTEPDLPCVRTSPCIDYFPAPVEPADSIGRERQRSGTELKLAEAAADLWNRFDEELGSFADERVTP